MTKIKQILAINKARFTRGYSWIGILGISLVISKTIQDILKSYINIPLWLLFPSGVFGLWFIGYIDHKQGFLAEEQNHTSKNNPLLIKILKDNKK